VNPKNKLEAMKFFLSLRQNGKGPRGKTETVLDHNQRPRGGHLVEIGHDLDLITAARQEIDFGRHETIVEVPAARPYKPLTRRGAGVF
jgi:hypothetical protein